MDSWNGTNHDGFTVKMSDLSCSGGVDYVIIIKENGNAIFKKSYNEDVILKFQTYHNSNFEVIIDNDSTNRLEYRVKINSYIR